MKKIYLILITIIFTVNFSYAQWVTSGSNIYYNSGNVGIGTTSPTANLTIAGSTIGSASSMGTVFRANSTATSGLVTGFYSNPTGAVTTNIGMWANVLNGTNNVNVLTGNNTPPTGNWDVYANSGATNYFSGNAGFGTTIPVACIQANITSGSSTAKGVLSTLYGSPLTSGGALYAAYYTGGTEASPVGPTVGSTINSYGFFTGGTAGGIFVNPSFAIQHTITSVSSALSNVNTSFMTNSTASGVPYAALTIQGQISGGGVGNIGIGTTTPLAKEHITGTSSLATATTSDMLILERPYNSGIAFGRIGTIALGSGEAASAGSGRMDFRLNPVSAGIGPNPTSIPALTTVMTMLGTGKVGIGTTTPNTPLDVSGLFTTGGQQANLAPGSPTGNISYLQNSGQMMVGWNMSNSLGETDFIANPGAGTEGGYAFYNMDNSGTLLQTLRIKQNGNTGIGVDNPDAKLAVNGTVHAKEVLVDLNIFPDYVFKPAYHLPTLTEVKTYIDKNHHLPDMPTEADVIKNGLKVGETEALLTKKVEELTLYIIEKDKEVKSQQKEIDALKTQMSTLLNRKP